MIPQGYPTYPKFTQLSISFSNITLLRRDKTLKKTKHRLAHTSLSKKCLSPFLHRSMPHEGQTGQLDTKGSPTLEPDCNNLTKHAWARLHFTRVLTPLGMLLRIIHKVLRWNEVNSIQFLQQPFFMAQTLTHTNFPIRSHFLQIHVLTPMHVLHMKPVPPTANVATGQN